MASGPVRCQKCKGALKLEALIVGDQFYHPDCLKCDSCSKKIEQQVYQADAKTLCKPCYVAKYTPKCTRCQKSIEGKIMELLGKEYHPSCQPQCFRCQKPPPDGQYASSGDNKPACLECYWMSVRDDRKQGAKSPGAGSKSSQSPKSVPAK